MKTEYYIEFVAKHKTNDYSSYTMQSKWFETKRKALNWVKKSFDYINLSQMKLYLMSGTFNEEGDLVGDIEQVEELDFSRGIANI